MVYDLLGSTNIFLCMEINAAYFLIYLIICGVQLIKGGQCQQTCPCSTTATPDITYKEIRPYENVDFQPLSVTREFDISTFTVTYTAKTLKKVYDIKNNAILKARLKVSALEKRIGNHPVIVLSSQSSSSTFILGVNTMTTKARQTYFSGTACSYRISSTDTWNIIGYDSRASCYRQSRGVYSYFKATLKGTRKGSKLIFDDNSGESVSKNYFNSTSSVDGRTASCFVNPTRMLVDGIKLDTLKFELLMTPDTQAQQLVAFSLWSFDLV